MELLERQPHLDELAALLHDAAAGRGRLILVGGEAGIGKTVLVSAFCRIGGAAARVRLGACDALSPPRPLGPIVDIAHQSNGELRHLLHSGARRDQIFDAVLNELTGGSRPNLMVFEDIHWADEATLDLLRFLARRLGSLRAVVIATYRDDEIGPRHSLRLVLGDLATSPVTHRLTLPPLSESAVRALARESPLDAAALYRRTNGNPFFVVEVLATGGRGIPATVRDAVLARAARLSAVGRAALEAAAVIGNRSEPWLLAELLGSDVAALDECIETGMLRAEATALAFHHEVAQEAVLATIPPHRRIALHRRVLDALRINADDPDGLARIAHHAELAGDRQAVLAYAPAAARRAAELKAHREAVAQYARALRFAGGLEPVARAPFLEGLAYQCYLTDRHDESVDAWTQALEIWRKAGNRRKEGEVLRHLSRTLWYLGRSPEAEEAVLAALRVLERLPPGSELGWTYGELSRVQMLAGRNGAAIAWGERALALAERLQDPGLQADVLSSVGSAKVTNGDLGGQAELERSLDVALAANLDDQAGRAYANLASVAIAEFQLERAERYLDEGLAYTLDHDIETYFLCLLAWRPTQLLYRGRWSEATDAADTLLRRPDLTALYRLQALIPLGRVRARRGDPEVGAALDQALAVAGPSVDTSRVGAVRAARAEAAWLAGDRAQAAVEARAIYDSALALNDRWLAGELAFWLWQTGELTAPPPEAAEPFALQIAGEWTAAAASWQALGCPYEAARALADSGDEASLRHALAEFDRLGARPMAAVVARRLRDLGVRRIPRGPRPTTRANPAGLTARELDILPLLGAGRRNAEIAACLFLSPKTVEHHVGSILAKLGVPGRGDVVAAAERLGVSVTRDQNGGTGSLN